MKNLAPALGRIGSIFGLARDSEHDRIHRSRQFEVALRNAETANGMLGRLRGLEGLALDCLGFFFRQQSAGKIVGNGSRRGDRWRYRRRGRRIAEISRRRFGATCEESQGSDEKKETPAKVNDHGIT